MRFKYFAVLALVFGSHEPSSVLAQSRRRRSTTTTYNSNNSTSGDSPIHDNNESNRKLNEDQTFQFSSSAHACLLAYDIVQCVGFNYYGQLGQSSSDTFGTPVQLNFPSSITAKPIKVVTGYDHTCTLFNDGHVWCNGSNGFQQLGDETTTNSATPVQVKKNGAVLTNVIHIEAGAYHNCAIQNTGAVYCWGFSEDGQLGLNSLADGIDQARSAVLIALSMSATCIITELDTTQAICVGYGYSSNSGNASTTIELGHGVTALTAGSTHFCALLDTTKAKCWGANNQGQLGIGSAEFTSAYISSPVFVLQDSTGTELSGISGINAAYLSTCLVVSGSPMCFGNNNYYQLGIANGGANVLYPALVSLFDGITGKSLSSMHVGEYTGHALFDDGSVYSVGTNYGGTFGDGSTIGSRNVIGDISGDIAKQISFMIGSSSPSLVPSNSPSSSPSELPSLSPSSNPSQDPYLLGDENSHITFDNVDFGSTNNVKGIKITYANGEVNSSGSVGVKLGDASGTTIAQFTPVGTDTWDVSNIMLIPFDKTVQLSGVNSLTFTTSETTAAILLISYELIDLSERYTPFTTLHATEVSTCSGVFASGDIIGAFDNGDYFTYSPIDFGSGANSIKITYAKGTTSGSFEIRKGDHETGEIIGTYSPASTGTSWGTFVTVEIPIKTSYGIDQLTFRGTYSNGGIMNLRSFQLSPVSAGYICLDTTPRTHTESVQAAAAAQTGANLVSIHCSAQQDVVSSLPITTDTWIGGTDAANEGVWVLPDGNAMTYSNWNTGEPNNSDGNGDPENSLIINSDGRWNDGSGSYSFGAIFESTFVIPGLQCIPYVECQDTVKIVENGIQSSDTRLRNNNLVTQSDTAGTYLSVPGRAIFTSADNWNIYNLPIGANDDFVLLAKIKVDGFRSGAAIYFANDNDNFCFDNNSNEIGVPTYSAFHPNIVNANYGTHNDNLFYFKVERKLGNVKFYLNGLEVHSTANYNAVISKIMWRPHRANLKIYDFTVSAPSLLNFGFSASGGDYIESGGYGIHTFTSSGTFMVNAGTREVEFLIIAGGGSGGIGTSGNNCGGGGGGAGGYISSVVGESSGGGCSPVETVTVTSGSYSIVVGAGGAAVVGSNQAGLDGGNSSAFGHTAIGGGGGSNRHDTAGKLGGSGGGGSCVGYNGSGTSCQGYQGGGGQSTPSGGTYGGGGAGGFDSTPPNGVGGPGGAGVTSTITGFAFGRAGGGGGGGGSNTTGGSATNGGGSGGNAPRGTGSSGAPNTGGGGGGAGGFSDSSTTSGAGGSGVVIIRYPIADPGYICLQTSLFSWQSSQDVATANGANLVSIRCAEQNQRLSGLISSDRFWVGGSDSASEGDWVFLDGRGSVTYTNWGSGQPNNSYGNENCMDLNYPSTGFWNDSPCTGNRKAIYHSTTPIAGMTCMSYVLCNE